MNPHSDWLSGRGGGREEGGGWRGGGWCGEEEDGEEEDEKENEEEDEEEDYHKEVEDEEDDEEEEEIGRTKPIIQRAEMLKQLWEQGIGRANRTGKEETGEGGRASVKKA